MPKYVKLSDVAIKELMIERDRIIEHPETFDMDAWCGTSYCIAGGIVARHRGCSYGQFTDVQAAAILELSTVHAYNIFLTQHWPLAARADYHAARTEAGRNRVAARYLNHLIKTKKLEVA